MVFYYSASNRTAVFAAILGKILNIQVHKLDTELDPSRKLLFFIKCMWLSITKKIIPVTNMPSAKSIAALDTIYLCAPIWAGQAAAPIRYFLLNAPVRDKKICLLLTCSFAPQSEAYRVMGEELLKSTGCKVGWIHVFVTGAPKTSYAPDSEVIEEQLRDMLDA